ncbi:hypothetical protein [Domibacillus enclensis]|uniref:Uncharacterized protein n=1 Tax=Domibacillus enclensis TaxID=1017273 RepID=A0A1N6S664_9BACI|nr:hypothetical protein [Domibacillus enclensis]OXS79227.1 hypothetical protein B1B05_05510 [Domibacillus enclensis]SIQ36569.1 hypothetical protein SAMN05443094_102326 [Domibacillus enclensis]
MEKSMESSLIFVNGCHAEWTIRFMTVYQDGVIMDAEFSSHASSGNKEWALGTKGAVKLLVAQGGVWQEIMVEYNLPKGYLHLTAVTAKSFSHTLLDGIFKQFFIRKGKVIQFLSVRSFSNHASVSSDRVLTIRIPTA